MVPDASPVSLVALRCRASGPEAALARGVDELGSLAANRLGVAERSVGSPSSAAGGPWDRDLDASRGCLREAGGQVDDALDAGRVPVLIAGDCAIALATVPTVARHRPDARILWLDAHGDSATPTAAPGGSLARMALSGSSGYWDAGLEAGAAPAEQIVLTGVRDLDASERDLLERSPATVIGASLETLVYTQNALDRAPVYVHLDLDVVDPEELPAQTPAPGGLATDKLYDLLEAVAGECELVGLELAGFAAPADDLERRLAASTILVTLEPLLAVITARRDAHVSH